MKLRSSVCFAFPPTHLTDSRSGIELLCFSGILSTSTSKSVVRRWLKKIKERKGVGGQGRDKSLWLSLHTMVLIWISPYIADHQSEWCPWWSVVFVVPHMNSKNPRDTFSSFCLCPKLFGTGRDGMKKLRGQQVQTLDAAYQTSHRVKEHLNWLQTKLNKFQAIRLWHFVLMNFLTGYTYRQSMHKAPSCLHLYFWWLKLVFS